MNNRKTISAGIGKLKQRLADPRPLSDVERKQVIDFLNKIEAETDTVRVYVEPMSIWKVNLGEYFLKGLAAGAGLVIAPFSLFIVFMIIEAILAASAVSS